MSALGKVIITCPTCGESLLAEVRLDGVGVLRRSLSARFHTAVIEHACEGR